MPSGKASYVIRISAVSSAYVILLYIYFLS